LNRINRCNGRLYTKRFTRFSHTGLVVELDLKIKTRLTNEKFASVKGERKDRARATFEKK